MTRIESWTGRKILVPMDDTRPSRVAFKQALRLARRMGAEVEVVHVQPWLARAAGLGIGDPGRTGRASFAAWKRLKAIAGSRAQVFSLPGEPVKVVPAWAARRRCGLIVMGSHGRSGWERALHGSVAEEMARSSRVPVLVYKQASEPPKAVLAPFNLRPYSLRGLSLAARAAAALGARLTVLFVGDPLSLPDRAAVKRVERSLERAVNSLPAATRAACKPRIRIASGEPARAILAAGRGYGMIVLAARRSRLFGDFVLGGTTTRVLRHARAAVLAVPV